MIEDVIVGFIIGMIIGYLAFLIKRYRDVKKSLKRIGKNNVGKFNLDEGKGNDSPEEGNSELQRSVIPKGISKDVSSGANNKKTERRRIRKWMKQK